jgi:anti-anti-sigma factor
VFDRARGWDFAWPGAGLNGTGLNGAGLNGAGLNGAGLNGAGLNGAEANGTIPNGAGLNGAGLNGTAWNGGAAGPHAAGGPPVVSLGLTHRIYPDGHAVAVICGELDAATADQAYEYVCQVIDRSRGPVRIDLAGLTFCDARGLRTLVGVAAHARKAARRLSLVAPRPAIIKIMRITGVDANFPELCPPGSRVSRP